MEIDRIANQRTRGNSAHKYISFPIHHFVVRSMLKYLIAREILIGYVSEVYLLCDIVAGRAVSGDYALPSNILL